MARLHSRGRGGGDGHRFAAAAPPPPVTTAEPGEGGGPAQAARVRRTRSARGPPRPRQAGQLAAAAPRARRLHRHRLRRGRREHLYAGGTTTSRGTSKTPARGTGRDGQHRRTAATRARSQARSVSLDQEAWNCPLARRCRRPAGQRTDRRSPGGRGRRWRHVEHVDVPSDPGFGVRRRRAHVRTADALRAGARSRRRADRRRVPSDTRALLPLTIPMRTPRRILIGGLAERQRS